MNQLPQNTTDIKQRIARLKTSGATRFHQAPLNDFEKFIQRHFRVDQMKSLQRVAIYTNGQLALEFIRAIVRSFP